MSLSFANRSSQVLHFTSLQIFLGGVNAKYVFDTSLVCTVKKSAAVTGNRPQKRWTDCHHLLMSEVIKQIICPEVVRLHVLVWSS